LLIEMTKQVLETGEHLEKVMESQVLDMEKKSCSIENVKSIDKDVNEPEEGPGQPMKRENSENVIQGIHFSSILETIPQEFRLEASEYFRDNNIADTLSTKIFPHWNEKQQSEVIDQILGDSDSGIYANILIKLFKINEHIETTRSHKRFVEKTFYRFKSLFKHLQERTILDHDQSKLSFVEIVGYTDKWVWCKNSPLWEQALAHHYQHNPHHPQNVLGLRMTPEAIEESLVDMMACHWERKEGGGDDVPAERIGGFDEFYLERYVPEDRKIVEELLRNVRESGL